MRVQLNLSYLELGNLEQPEESLELSQNTGLDMSFQSFAISYSSYPAILNYLSLFWGSTSNLQLWMTSHQQYYSRHQAPHAMYKKKWAPFDKLKSSLVARPGGHKRRKLKSILIHLCRISVFNILQLVNLS